MVFQEEWPNGRVALDLPDMAVAAAIVVAVVAAVAAAAAVVVAVVAAAVAVVVAQIRVGLVEETCPFDWWKQDCCTARKVCTRSAMAV